MKLQKSIIAAGLVVGSVTIGNAATVLGFGQLGGNNTNIPTDFGSNASANANGLVVSGGGTPNIGLTWGADWDIHTSGHFSTLEETTVGGGDWDNEGGIPRIAQLDVGNHSIVFSADPGAALVLRSFDFGHTAETAGSSTWDLALTNASDVVVWSQTLVLDNADPSTAVATVTPDFVGDFGASYTLSFDRTAETYGSNGRHGLDNLTFSQVVPEPTTAALAGLAGFALLLRRRK